MKIGIVSTWVNRGQSAVARDVRSIFEDAGHETHILARPINPNMRMEQRIDLRGDADVPNLTVASDWEPEADEYVAWARDAGIELLFCDMNLQFDAIAAVRDTGVGTIGRFVWERFSAGHVKRADRSYDVVYSLTRAEQARYRELGLESPYVPWGIHPRWFDVTPDRPTDRIDFLFHGGMQGRRKPIEATVAAFKRVDAPHIRLVLKNQGSREMSERPMIEDDPRILEISADLDPDEYAALLGSSHVCLAPARWEGLGVHLYEALALGMPTISNDIPPIDEVVEHGVSGLLCRSVPIGERPNGLPIFDPDIDDLARCIEELADPERLAQMTASTFAHRASRDWDSTRDGYLGLATSVLGTKA